MRAWGVGKQWESLGWGGSRGAGGAAEGLGGSEGGFKGVKGAPRLLFGRPPAGSSAPSGSAPPGPAAGGRAAAARSVCPWRRSQGSCWCVRPPGCPGEPSAGHWGAQHLGVPLTPPLPPLSPPRYQFASSKQSHAGGVGVQADLMLAGRVRGEGEAALGAVLPRQHHLTAGRGNAAGHCRPPPPPAAPSPLSPACTPCRQGPSLPRASPAPGWRAGRIPTACPTAVCGSSLRGGVVRAEHETPISPCTPPQPL